MAGAPSDRVVRANPIEHHCTFCEEISSGVFKLNVPVLEAGNFIVLADIAPAAFGHLIVLPRLHCWSLAELGPEKLGELNSILQTLIRVAGIAFEHVAIAEHGSNNETVLHAGCVEHAHIHLCPVKCAPNLGVKLVNETVLNQESRLVGFLDLASLRGQEYLLWGNGLSEWFVWAPKSRKCSQILRGVMNALNDRDPTQRWQQAISRVKAVQAANLFRHLLREAER
jgi:diadenosine tetraphosphate (Ap4A) HIT family hydrolase